jgi:hypothetical protein
MGAKIAIATTKQTMIIPIIARRLFLARNRE